MLHISCKIGVGAILPIYLIENTRFFFLFAPMLVACLTMQVNVSDIKYAHIDVSVSSPACIGAVLFFIILSIVIVFINLGRGERDDLWK